MTAPASGRWTPARKAEELIPIIRGEKTAADAIAAGFTVEELIQAAFRFGKHGQAGLSQTRLQRLGRAA